MPRILDRQRAADGTRKWLLAMDDDDNAVECVLIPEKSRMTLCVSSQVGCTLNCTFCSTAKQGFNRNLTTAEIIAQLHFAHHSLIAEGYPQGVTNVVFMGMGEPLLNWPAVDVSLTILNDPAGLGIGARHITVSTVGILPGMRALAARPEQFRLALSLHSPESDARLALMPIEKKYPLAEVLEAAKTFRKRVTFEYVLIAGANDRPADADALARHARALGAMVNLLPLHPGGAPDLTPTSAKAVRSFANRLKDRGIEAIVRRSRGLDIDAACGQLAVAAGATARAAGAARAARR